MSRKIPNNIFYDFPTPLSAGFPLSQEIKKEQEFQKLFTKYVVVHYPILIPCIVPDNSVKKEGNNQMLFTFWDHSITTAILLTTYKYIALGREKECVLSDFKFWILILLFLCLNWQFLQNESLIAIDARAIRLYFRKNKFKLCR